MKRIIYGIGRALGSVGRATVALVGICGVVAALANNYTMTQGTGTTFGSLVIGSVNYAQQLICDATTPSQCAAVSSGGAVSVGVASGALASGAGTDGWDATQGATTNSPATLPASGTAATGVSLWKAIANSLNSLLAAATTPLSNSSAPINVSTATTTQLVALSGSTVIYVTSYDVIAAGTGNITFEYGTGTNCGTGTTSLTGAYNLTAQAGIAKGAGIGTVLKVPAGNALCVLTSAAVQMSGSVSFQQF
jgi:hypothetical protein